MVIWEAECNSMHLCLGGLMMKRIFRLGEGKGMECSIEMEVVVLIKCSLLL